MVTLKKLKKTYNYLLDNGYSHEKIIGRELEAILHLKRGIVNNFLRKCQSNGTILDKPYSSTYAFKYTFRNELDFPAYFKQAIDHYGIILTKENTRGRFREDMTRDTRIPLLRRENGHVDFNDLTPDISYLLGILSRQVDKGLKGGINFNPLTETSIIVSNSFSFEIVDLLQQVFNIYISSYSPDGADYSEVQISTGLVKYFLTDIACLTSAKGFFNLGLLTTKEEIKSAYVAGIFDVYLKIDTQSHIAKFNDNVQIKLDSFHTLLKDCFGSDIGKVEEGDRASITIYPEDLRKILTSSFFESIEDHLKNPDLLERIEFINLKIDEGKLSRRKKIPYLEEFKSKTITEPQTLIQSWYKYCYIDKKRILMMRYSDSEILEKISSCIISLGEVENYQFSPKIEPASNGSFNLFLFQKDVDKLREIVPFPLKLETYYQRATQTYGYRQNDLMNLVQTSTNEEIMDKMFERSTIDSKRMLNFSYFDNETLSKIQEILNFHNISSSLNDDRMQISPHNVDRLRDLFQFPDSLEQQYKYAIQPRFHYSKEQEIRNVIINESLSFDDKFKFFFPACKINKKRVMEIRFLEQDLLEYLQTQLSEHDISSTFYEQDNYICLSISPRNVDKLRDSFGLSAELEEQYITANPSGDETLKHSGLENVFNDELSIDSRIKACLDRLQIRNSGESFIYYFKEEFLTKLKSLIDEFFLNLSIEQVNTSVLKASPFRLRINQVGTVNLANYFGLPTKEQEQQLSSYVNESYKHLKEKEENREFFPLEELLNPGLKDKKELLKATFPKMAISDSRILTIYYFKELNLNVLKELIIQVCDNEINPKIIQNKSGYILQLVQSETDILRQKIGFDPRLEEQYLQATQPREQIDIVFENNLIEEKSSKKIVSLIYSKSNFHSHACELMFFYPNSKIVDSIDLFLKNDKISSKRRDEKTIFIRKNGVKKLRDIYPLPENYEELFQEYLSRKFTCENCSTDFPSYFQYFNHSKICGKHLFCPVCNRSSFTSWEMYQGHIWVCEEQPKCKKCGKTEFSSKKSYINHEKSCEVALDYL